MKYTQEYTKFVGPTSGNSFYLRGATVDLGYTLWKGIGVSASGTGLAATNLATNIDIHHVELLGGVRYTEEDKLGGTCGDDGRGFAARSCFPGHS